VYNLLGLGRFQDSLGSLSGEERIQGFGQALSGEGNLRRGERSFSGDGNFQFCEESLDGDSRFRGFEYSLLGDDAKRSSSNRSGKLISGKLLAGLDIFSEEDNFLVSVLEFPGRSQGSKVILSGLGKSHISGEAWPRLGLSHD
jgi:hypothetical protein